MFEWLHLSLDFLSWIISSRFSSVFTSLLCRAASSTTSDIVGKCRTERLPPRKQLLCFSIPDNFFPCPAFLLASHKITSSFKCFVFGIFDVCPALVYSASAINARTILSKRLRVLSLYKCRPLLKKQIL